MQVCKGIFWYEPNEHKLFTVKVRCNEKGIALEPVVYSSKSGENFNHKVEWAKLPKEITNGNPYNYYPRGKLFDEWDYQEKFSFKSYIGYGSKYDLNKIDLNLCCSCFDKVMDFIIPQCKIIPLEEYD